MTKAHRRQATAHRADPDRPPRAAIYLRISKDPTGQAAGVTRQREDCVKLAAQQGWDVFDIYTDNDVSATKKRKRPAYEQMLTAINAGQVDAVIAWHPDRLYRRMPDLEGLIDAIESRSVLLRTVRAGELDLSTPTGRQIARILAAVAQGEVEIKSDRWKRAWQQNREDGRTTGTGSRMFGYTRDWKIVDHEAAITRTMAAKIRQGSTILGVCRWLDEQGVRATRGSAWTPQSVKRYLTNPRLAGYSTLNGEIVADGQWEPILDRDTFETVRAMLTARTRQHLPRRSVLLGLIFCGKCGHRMITSASKTGRSYRCPNRPGMDGCGRVSGTAVHIEGVVEAYAQVRLADDRVRERLAELRAQPSDLLAEISALDARLAELEAQLDAPGVPVDTILRAITRAQAKRAELDEQLAGSVTPIPAASDVWPEDLQRRRDLIDLVVERVELLPRAEGRPNTFGFDPKRVDITEREQLGAR